MLKYLKIIIIGSFLLGELQMLVAQVSAGGTPYSFTHGNLIPLDEVALLDLPPVPLGALLEAEALRKDGEKPPRFGYAHEVDIDLIAQGSVEDLPDGGRLWRLGIMTENAFSVNLIYDHFRLPVGGRLYLYNEGGEMLLGAFTERNNKPHGKFSTGLVKGDRLFLEYYQPPGVSEAGIIRISKVIHGFRDILPDLPTEGFGDSGECNVNVNCPAGDPWKSETRSVAMVLADDNTRLCSGFLINNLRQDQTPYFMVAEHCLSPDYQTWLFIFNYQSPGCGNIDGPLDQSISGASLVAKHHATDFALLHLSDTPPLAYGVYYAGWSALNTPPSSSATIHHPRGDIKKISIDNDPAVSSSWPGTPPNSHWKVIDWDLGTTEVGSSGSPLFNQNHQAVGWLHGGAAACENDEPDWYGKLAFAWYYGNTPAERLKDWLDPDNSGTLTLAGLDPNLPYPDITHTPLPNTEELYGPYLVEATVTTIYQLAAVRLYFGLDSTVSDSLTMTPAGNDLFTAAIPGYGQPADYCYFIAAVDTGGRISTHPWGAPEELHCFRAAPDLTPPQIVHIPLGNQPLSIWPAEISADVSDNLAVAAVWVDYSVNGGAGGSGSFDLLPGSGTTYLGSFPIPAASLSAGDTIAYRIVAEDNSQLSNRATHPASGDHRFQAIDQLGRILIVNDDSGNQNVEYTGLKGRALRDPRQYPFGLSAQLMAARLTAIGFSAVIEEVEDTDPASWGNYDLLISSSGFNDEPVGAGWFRAALESWVSDTSHKLLVEGGEVGYAATIYPEYPSFAAAVLHTGDWSADNAGNLYAIPGQAGHIMRNCPHPLPNSISITYHDWASQDAVDVIGGAYLLYDTQAEPGYAGISVYDNDNDPRSAQIVYFPFNYADLTMASTAEALLENAVDYLMQLECPVGNGRSVSEFPQHFELLPNYPNPFNPETVVSYRLSVVSDVKLAIYNVLGELVRNLHQRRETPGLHSVRWDGRDDAGRPVCSGVYIYRLETAQQTATRKMILLR